MQESGVAKLQKALELLRTTIRGKDSRKELPVQMLVTYLLVVQNKGITMKEAAKEMGVEQSTISRNVKDLDVYLEEDTAGNRVMLGCGLLQRVPNEINRREFSVFPTEKGLKLAKEIDNILK
jgi:DNA-binding MarR family transcriptional regulator